MKYLFSKPLVSLFALAGLFGSSPSFAMVEMKDEQLSEVTGQALLQMGKIEGMAGTVSENMTFYKAGLDAEIELNMNIEKIQLGCTGNTINGNHCDIDIRNFSLSGLPSNLANNPSTSESPDFTPDGGRAATSALLTRPFFEFAVDNDQSKTLREVVGIRLGAESMLGMLSSGLMNGAAPSTTDGIQTLSGYLQIAGTTGEVTTEQAIFGDSLDERISGLLDIALFGDRDFTSNLGGFTSGITVPSMNVGFNLPGFTVTGKRLTTAVANNVTALIPEIPLAPGCGENGADDGCGIDDSVFASDQLGVDVIPCVELFGFCLVDEAAFQMGDDSSLQNLNMNITFAQALSMFHNIPLRDSGFYLSLQDEDVYWPGSNADDIAQQGWWMSFKEPAQLGYLQASNEVDISAVLPQVATLITQELQKEENRVSVNFGEALGAVFENPIIKTLNIDIGAFTAANPATLTLANQQLTSQEVVPNCWGASNFC